VSFAVSDAVSSVLHTALDGLSLRQNVIADDIANVDTPNFRASSVDFEDSLRRAVADGAYDDGGAGAQAVSVTEEATQTPVGANGNNVDLRKETLAAMQTTYQYQLISRAMDDHYNLLKTAAVTTA
jgi:flagellar basal-body rod protein FlgB